jgi:hypothetical protein
VQDASDVERLCHIKRVGVEIRVVKPLQVLGCGSWPVMFIATSHVRDRHEIEGRQLLIAFLLPRSIGNIDQFLCTLWLTTHVVFGHDPITEKLPH